MFTPQSAVVRTTLLACFIAGFFMPHLPAHPLFSAIIPPLAIVGFALPGFTELLKKYKSRGAWALLLLFVVAVSLEALSITTGFPYSQFTYADSAIGTKLFSLVPWTVPFAWVPLVLGTYALITSHLTRPSAGKVLARAALFLTAIDLCLDPIIVKLGYWHYLAGGIYYQVPFQNFLGWILSGAYATWILGSFIKWKPLSTPSLLGLLAILLFWSGAAMSTLLLLPTLAGIGCILMVTKKLTQRA